MIRTENMRGVPRNRRTGRHGFRAPASLQYQRRQAVRRRRTVLAALGLALCVECAAAALTSPWMSVRRVSLYGVAGLMPEEVESAVRAARLPSGTNLFSPKVQELSQTLTGQPFISHAAVSRSFPPEVSVTVSPRIPHVVALVGGLHWEIDRSGFAIRRGLPDPKIPLVQAINTPPASAGERIGNESFQNALGLIDVLKREVDLELDKIVIDPRGQLCLNMHDGLVIRLGLAESLNQKVALVRKIYQEQPEAATLLKSVDLTAPGNPVCIVKSESERRAKSSGKQTDN